VAWLAAVAVCKCSAVVSACVVLLRALQPRRRRAVEEPADAAAGKRPPLEEAPMNLFERLGRPTHVVAPMVDQSELPFRLLTRRYGAQLCYTPMVNANQFNNSSAYREEVLAEANAADRPLVVQFAGHDAETLLRAARHVEHMCDAVDLNLGCPQGIARRGRYGAFLLEEEDLVVDIVRTLSSKLQVPVTCKIRLFRDDLDRTLRLCNRLQEAGCAMLTVHGRTRHQNKQTVGSCNFQAIAAVKAAMRIPVIANGGIATLEDVERCLRETGADAVMSSEAILENPALFAGNVDSEGRHVGQARLAREYLELAEEHLRLRNSKAEGDAPKCVKAHIFKMLFAGLQDNHDLRDRVSNANCIAEFRSILEELERREWQEPSFHREDAYLRHRSWYFRHRLSEAQRLDGVPEPPAAAARGGGASEVGDGAGTDAREADADEGQFCVSWD